MALQTRLPGNALNVNRLIRGNKCAMILLDSNIVIYLRDPRLSEAIVQQFGNERLNTCNIVIAEVLGFNGLDLTDIHYFEQLFDAMKNHPFNDAVTGRVIELRRMTKMQLPDAII